MKSEKKYFGGWWMWVVLLMVITSVIFFVLNSFGIIGTTIVERKVFENSYQKHEADKTALTIFDAQLAQLRAKLNNPSLDANTKAEIRAQIDSITILKAAKED